MRERHRELDEVLHELGMSETKVWIFRAQKIFQLALMVELGSAEIALHIRRMSSYSEILCRQIQFSAAHRELTRLASQLHDIGKIAVPDELLLKSGELTAGEHAVLREHAEAGYRLLSVSSCAVVQLGGVVARAHHERWDGGGYPQGLSGRDIPLLGRIAAVADTFDGLTGERRDRAPMPFSLAAEQMRDERGAALDPLLVDRFLEAMPELEAAHGAHRDS